MPAGEVIASYHELWHVEASFRMSKSDLRARPIFHHTRDAIEAHLTIVFAALAVARYLQDATGMSIKKIVRPRHPHRHRPRSRDTLNWHDSGLTAVPRRRGVAPASARCHRGIPACLRRHEGDGLLWRRQAIRQARVGPLDSCTFQPDLQARISAAARGQPHPSERGFTSHNTRSEHARGA
jgi:hypothetical protein